jgi:hypothetical protein
MSRRHFNRRAFCARPFLPTVRLRQRVRAGFGTGVTAFGRKVGRLSGEIAENFGSFGNTERRQNAVVSRDAGPLRGPRKAPLAAAVGLCGGTGADSAGPGPRLPPPNELHFRHASPMSHFSPSGRGSYLS